MGTLYIVSTPIGNLEDITIRAIKTLFMVDMVACEDTRRTGLLLSELKKRYAKLTSVSENEKPRLIAYYDEVERQRTPEIVALLKAGKSVALVSDAGTPLISDPGYWLVKEAMRQGVKVVSIPGSTAAVAALTSSGLSADKFTFLGYPPEKSSHRIKLFNNVLLIHRCISSTFIFYCAPHKLRQTLRDMQEVLGNRQIAICRELTKVYEDSWVGTVSEALDSFQTIKGEVVLLLRLP